MARKSERQKKEPGPIGQWVKVVRTLKGLEQSEFAEYIGKSRSAVGMYETGSPVPAETIALIQATWEDIPRPPAVDGDVEIRGKAIGSDTYATIKYAGVVPCSREWGDPLESEERRPIDEKFTGLNRFLAKVVGDSCWPALQQGDLTVWESDRYPVYGTIVLAERSTDQACTVKQLQYDEAQRRPILVPVNPTHEAPPEDDGWECTARLVGVIRKGDGPERTWYWAPGLRPQHLLD